MTANDPASRPRSVTRAAAGMGGVTVVSRLMGFVRVLVIAAVLGTTYLGNTFQASNSVSNILFELLAAGALSAVLVPTFVTLNDGGDSTEADRLANGLLGYALVLLGAVTVLGMALSPLLARLLSSGAPNATVASQQRHLSTFLLVFFLPQVVLYAFGGIATGLLYAVRRFSITAAAPIGSSVVMIGCFIAFRIMAGPDPTFDLTAPEKALLAFAGTGGVIAFVGILVVAARRSGFTLRPVLRRGDPALTNFARLAVWGAMLNAGAALLLGAASIAGNGVAGGVVAYQVAFVFFLAPYAVLAQPLHTAMLPEMSMDAAAGSTDALAGSIRWTLDRMALLVIPVSAAMVVFALPAMRLVSFGSAAKTGPALLAAGVASLALGLFPYSAFLLLARSYYTLGDSRTPAIVAIGSAVIGVVTMVVGSRIANGAALVAMLGLGHSLSYAIGAVVLGVGCTRRIQRSIVPVLLPIATVIGGVIAFGAWLVMRALDPQGRGATVLCLALVAGVATVAYALAVRRWWRTADLAPAGA
jgi:putative peptidoglycan lipid II flippase